MQVDNIIQGWKSFLKGENNDLATCRAVVCKECKHAVIGKFEKFLKDYSIKEIEGLKCNECGCPLSAKLRSKKEKCPIGNW